MKSKIPTVGQVKTALKRLSHDELERLGRATSVPYSTLVKIRQGTTRNPGLATVRKFASHINLA